MKTLEGMWDCSNCLTTGIPGLTTTCPNCHDPRNVTLTPEEAPYLPRGAREITDAAELALANAGAEWNCGHCGTTNQGNQKFCQHCGQKRDGDDFTAPVARYVTGDYAKGVHFDKDTVEADARIERLLPDPLVEGERLITGHSDDVRTAEHYTHRGSQIPRTGQIATRVESYKAKPKNIGEAYRQYRWEFIAAGVILTLLLTYMVVHFLFLSTKPLALTVSELNWQRQVEVESIQTFHEEDWTVPAGGRETSNYPAVFRYNKVVDHYETNSHSHARDVPDGTENYTYDCGSETVSNGNGTFTERTKQCTGSRSKTRTEVYYTYSNDPVYRNDPVYATKYRYDIERWASDHWEVAGGHGGELDNPHWPDFKGIDASHRLSGRTDQSYTVTLSADNAKSYTRSLQQNVWDQLHKSQHLDGEIDRTGHIRNIKWPKALPA